MQLAFLLVCFAGLAYMFLTVQRTQEAMLRAMREDHVQLRTLIRALEARLDAELDAAPAGNNENPHARPAPARVQPQTEVGPEPVARRDDSEPPVFLKGTTVTQAAEMLRTGQTLKDIDLRLDEADSRRSGGPGMPDLKF